MASTEIKSTEIKSKLFIISNYIYAGNDIIIKNLRAYLSKKKQPLRTLPWLPCNFS